MGHQSSFMMNPNTVDVSKLRLYYFTVFYIILHLFDKKAKAEICEETYFATALFLISCNYDY